MAGRVAPRAAGRPILRKGSLAPVRATARAERRALPRHLWDEFQNPSAATRDGVQALRRRGPRLEHDLAALGRAEEMAGASILFLLLQNGAAERDGESRAGLAVSAREQAGRERERAGQRVGAGVGDFAAQAEDHIVDRRRACQVASVEDDLGVGEIEDAVGGANGGAIERAGQVRVEDETVRIELRGSVGWPKPSNPSIQLAKFVVGVDANPTVRRAASAVGHGVMGPIRIFGEWNASCHLYAVSEDAAELDVALGVDGDRSVTVASRISRIIRHTGHGQSVFAGERRCIGRRHYAIKRRASLPVGRIDDAVDVAAAVFVGAELDPPFNDEWRQTGSVDDIGGPSKKVELAAGGVFPAADRDRRRVRALDGGGELEGAGVGVVDLEYDGEEPVVRALDRDERVRDEVRG